jgi:DNA-directed RNA polymerase specialized sigma24 family protein
MAHDISQETYVALRTGYGHIDDETELVKLAFSISRYIWLRRRGKANRELCPPEDWNPADTGIDGEDQTLRAEVRTAIQELTGRCPELLLLQLDGYTADEIKVSMGAPRIDTVYVWIHRCIAALRKKLGAGGRK